MQSSFPNWDSHKCCKCNKNTNDVKTSTRLFCSHFYCNNCIMQFSMPSNDPSIYQFTCTVCFETSIFSQEDLMMQVTDFNHTSTFNNHQYSSNEQLLQKSSNNESSVVYSSDGFNNNSSESDVKLSSVNASENPQNYVERIYCVVQDISIFEYFIAQLEIKTRCRLSIFNPMSSSTDILLELQGETYNIELAKQMILNEFGPIFNSYNNYYNESSSSSNFTYHESNIAPVHNETKTYTKEEIYFNIEVPVVDMTIKDIERQTNTNISHRISFTDNARIFTILGLQNDINKAATLLQNAMGGKGIRKLQDVSSKTPTDGIKGISSSLNTIDSGLNFEINQLSDNGFSFSSSITEFVPYTYNSTINTFDSDQLNANKPMQSYISAVEGKLPYRSKTESSRLFQFPTNTTQQSPSLSDDSGDVTMVLDIHSEILKLLTGNRGIVIKTITRKTKANISIIDSDSNVTQRVEFSGKQDAVKHAMTLVEGVIQFGVEYLDNNMAAAHTSHDKVELEKDSNSRSQAKNKTAIDDSSYSVAEMFCPTEKISVIIGAKGVIIKEISRRSNAQISISEESKTFSLQNNVYVPHKGDTDCVLWRRIELRGNHSEIELAKNLITSIVEGGPNAIYTSSRVDGNNFNESLMKSVPVGVKITTEIPCPKDKVGAIIGSRGAVVRELIKSTSTQISVGDEVVNVEAHQIPSMTSSGSKELVEVRMVSVRGFIEDVNKAVSMVEDIIRNSASISNDSTSRTFDNFDEGQYNDLLSRSDDMKKFADSSELFLCPLDKVGEIIGWRGSIIKSLSQQSGAKIILANETIKSHKVVDFKGTAEQIALARQLVKDIIDGNSDKGKRFRSTEFDEYNSFQRNIEVSNSVMKLLKLAYNKQMLLNMVAESLCHISLEDDIISISSHDSNQVLIAVEKVNSFINNLVTKDSLELDMENLNTSKNIAAKPVEQDNLTTRYQDDNSILEIDETNLVHDSIECPNEKVGLIIGSKGVVIKSMMNRSKAKIIVTSEIIDGKTVRHVEISGTYEQVQAARKMVDCVIEHGNEALDQSGVASLGLGIITKHLILSQDAIKNIVGPRGSTMKRIYNESMASITISKSPTEDNGNRQVAVKGTITEVERALALINVLSKNPEVRSDKDNDDFNEYLSNEDSLSLPRKSSKSINSPVSSPQRRQGKLYEDLELDDDKDGNKISKKKVNMAVKSIRCPMPKVGSLIGTKGSVIKEVMRRTGTTIIVGDVNEANDFRDVTIKGTQAAVIEAEKFVVSIIDVGTKILGMKYGSLDE